MTGSNESSLPATPEAMLDDVARHVEWTEARRASCLDDLILGFAPEDLRRAAEGRLHRLDHPDGELALRLLEVVGDASSFEALACAIRSQPELSPERAWEALTLLRDVGALDHHAELRALFDDLDGLAEDQGEEGGLALELAAELADALTEGGDEAIVAVAEALAGFEEDLRQAILNDLRERITPEVLCALSHPPTLLPLNQSPRLEANPIQAVSRPAPALDWSTEARSWADQGTLTEGRSDSFAFESGMRLVDGMVTALDRLGRGVVALTARGQAGHVVTGVFVIDVREGVLTAAGRRGGAETAAIRAELLSRTRCDLLTDVPGLAHDWMVRALGLDLRTGRDRAGAWLECLGWPRFHDRHPNAVALPNHGIVTWVVEPDAVNPRTLSRWAERIWRACPHWCDQSEITFELAEELILRERDPRPQPRRDAALFRYLFKKRLADQLERHRAMLGWMASFWNAGDAPDLVEAALGLAYDLGDPQNHRPTHPYVARWIRRSLEAAQDDLKRGLDPRAARESTEV